MATLKEDLEMFIWDEFFYENEDGEVEPYSPTDAEYAAWIEKLLSILRRHKYDLMQLACVRKSHPHIDSLPAPDKHAHQY